MRQTFTKSERLCSKKILGELFKKGSPSVQTFYLFPFRVLYMPTQVQMQDVASPDRMAVADASETQRVADAQETRRVASLPVPAIVITVPKRMFKRAVDRNLIRRRVREAYRLNKHLLRAESPRPAYIAFLYTAKQIISFEEIEKGMKLALRQLSGNSQQPTAKR
ncbi:ribonuclease P protein component [Spirosoma montaniterrae]|uniref:Ribonuclease P protein component n=1 Tax=Spirosoma montaniterrae TaxID=1178516 RepID=A0A1P9WRR3_9BACT|nr:ribonuclease P protein component [Spirosoma montaniterrae]AQG78054.1 ribonuclease P protein component [Spirosoma montaniterrae]